MAGVRPFGGATAADVFSSILRDPPPPLPSHVPADLCAVIERCLAKDPEDRYRDGVDVEAALETIQVGARVPTRPRRFRFAPRSPTAAAVGLVAVAGILLGLNAGGIYHRFLARIGIAPPPIRMAVLPFDNLAGDPQQEYFSEALTAELIAQLGRLQPQRLSVIARTSSMRYAKTDKPVDQIGRELGVDYLLEGTARQEAGRVRITATLIDVRNQSQRWSDTFERDLSNMLGLQGDIARGVARSLALTLLPSANARLAGVQSVDPKAQDLYMLGRYHTFKRTADSLNRAIADLQEATRLDPTFAAAYGALAFAFVERDIWASPGGPLVSRNQVRDAAQRALALDDTLAEAHLAMARVHFNYDWNWEAADTEFQRTLDLNPSLAEARSLYSFFLQANGREPEALESARQAVQLEPLSASYLSDEGRILFRARRYAEASERHKRALELDPTYVPAMSRLADAYLLLHKFDDMRTVLEQVPPAAESRQQALWAQLYARTGRVADARAIADGLMRQNRSDADLPYVYAAIGDRDKALALLERGVRDHSILAVVLRDPRFDELRPSPRFQELLRLANLAP